MGNKNKKIKGYQPEFENAFKEVYGLTDCKLDSFFNKIQVPYVPYYAYGEEIAVLRESGKEVNTLSESYENFNNLLISLDAPWEYFEEYKHSISLDAPSEHFEEYKHSSSKEKPKIFISYAFEDYEIAKWLYDDLKKAGTEPWLDREDLLPGQNWRTTIPQVIKACIYFLLLISKHSVSRQGYIQKEQKIALELLDEFPPNEICIIPAKIDNTEPIDERLKNLHWGDLSDYEEGFKKIIKSINPDYIPKGYTEQKMSQIEFVNRMNELQLITNIYGVPPYLVIVAPMGYGKTRLLQTVKKSLEDKGWMCIDISLSRKKKNTSIKEIAKIFFGEKDARDAGKNPQNAGYKSGNYILEQLKHNENKQQKKVLIQIDEAETLNTDSARELLNQFIPAIADTLKNADIELRVIFAGRYILNWQELSHELRLRSILLTPFDFDSVYQTVEFYDSNVKIAMIRKYRKDFSAWLMYFTGGHPGCMAEILINDYRSSIDMILWKEKENYDKIIKRFINDIKKQIPTVLKEIFNILSAVRRFNAHMLRNFMDNRFIEWSGDEYSLEDSLCQTYLVNRKDGFLQDDIARRLLSIHLRRTDLNLFNNICEKAISFYEERLKDVESYGRDIIAIELLFQKMQYISYKENGTREQFFNNLNDVFCILRLFP